MLHNSGSDRVAFTEREMRLSMRATVEAFHAYALASLSQGLAARGVDYEKLTLREQEIEHRRSGLPLRLFYSWLREDMLNVCVNEIDATMQ